MVLEFLLNGRNTVDLALFILRLGIGCIYIKHGALKLIRGKEELIWTGEQMGNLGIHVWPLFWGICAMLAELGGGILLIPGLGTKIAASFMLFTMLVAVVYHIKHNDPWGYVSYPLAMAVVFLSLLISGAGKYSIDWHIYQQLQKHL